MLRHNFLCYATVAMLAIAATISFSSSAAAQHSCDAFPIVTCIVPSSFPAPWTITDNNSTATGQTSEPRIYTGETSPLNSLWYRWAPPITARYIIDTRGTNPSGQTNFDTMIAVYSGGTTFASLTQLAANDDWAANSGQNGHINSCRNAFGVYIVPLPAGEWAGSSCVILDLFAGTTYYFQVDGFSGNVGPFNLNASVFVPTAANVSVGGRITDFAGNGVSRVQVRMTGPSGEVRTAITNTFGYYRIEDVAVGQTYIVEAASKKYFFDNNPRVLTVNDALSDVHFIASTP